MSESNPLLTIGSDGFIRTYNTRIRDTKTTHRIDDVIPFNIHGEDAQDFIAVGEYSGKEFIWKCSLKGESLSLLLEQELEYPLVYKKHPDTSESSKLFFAWLKEGNASRDL